MSIKTSAFTLVAILGLFLGIQSVHLSASNKQGCKASVQTCGKLNTQGIFENVLSYPEMVDLQPIIPGTLGYPDPRLDPNIAVGDDTILCIVTSSLAILERKTLEKVAAFSLVGDGDKPGLFSSSQWPQISNFPLLADPSIVWDERSERFWLLGFNPIMTPGATDLFLAVSKTSNPRSMDDFYTFNAQPEMYLDFPTIAVDDQAVYIGSFSFDPTEGGVILAYDLAPLLNGDSMNELFSYTNESFDYLGYIYAIQPRKDCHTKERGRVLFAQTTGAVVNDDGDMSGDVIRILKVKHVKTNPEVVISEVHVKPYCTSNYAAPNVEQLAPLENPFNLPLRPLRPYTITIAAEPALVGSQLWLAHVVNSDDNERNVARWYQMDVSKFDNIKILQQGNADDGYADVLYTGVNVDKCGNMGMVLSYAGKYNYVTLAYTGRLHSDPQGTVRMPWTKIGGGDLYFQRNQSFNGVGESIGIALGPDGRSFYAFGVDPMAVPATELSPFGVAFSDSLGVFDISKECSNTTFAAQTHNLLKTGCTLQTATVAKEVKNLAVDSRKKIGKSFSPQ